MHFVSTWQADFEDREVSGGGRGEMAKGKNKQGKAGMQQRANMVNQSKKKIKKSKTQSQNQPNASKKTGNGGKNSKKKPRILPGRFPPADLHNQSDQQITDEPIAAPQDRQPPHEEIGYSKTPSRQGSRDNLYPSLEPLPHSARTQTLADQDAGDACPSPQPGNESAYLDESAHLDESAELHNTGSKEPEMEGPGESCNEDMALDMDFFENFLSLAQPLEDGFFTDHDAGAQLDESSHPDESLQDREAGGDGSDGVQEIQEGENFVSCNVSDNSQLENHADSGLDSGQVDSDMAVKQNLAAVKGSSQRPFTGWSHLYKNAAVFVEGQKEEQPALPLALQQGVALGGQHNLLTEQPGSSLTLLTGCHDSQGFGVETAVLRAILYKNKSQLRRVIAFKYFQQVLKLMTAVEACRVPDLIHELQSLHTSSYSGGEVRVPQGEAVIFVLLRLRSAATLCESLVKAISKASLHILPHLARAHFIKTYLAILAVMARTQVLVANLMMSHCSNYNILIQSVGQFPLKSDSGHLPGVGLPQMLVCGWRDTLPVLRPVPFEAGQTIHDQIRLAPHNGDDDGVPVLQDSPDLGQPVSTEEQILLKARLEAERSAQVAAEQYPKKLKILPKKTGKGKVVGRILPGRALPVLSSEERALNPNPIPPQLGHPAAGQPLDARQAALSQLLPSTSFGQGAGIQMTEGRKPKQSKKARKRERLQQSLNQANQHPEFSIPNISRSDVAEPTAATETTNATNRPQICSFASKLGGPGSIQPKVCIAGSSQFKSPATASPAGSLPSLAHPQVQGLEEERQVGGEHSLRLSSLEPVLHAHPAAERSDCPASNSGSFLGSFSPEHTPEERCRPPQSDQAKPGVPNDLERGLDEAPLYKEREHPGGTGVAKKPRLEEEKAPSEGVASQDRSRLDRERQPSEGVLSQERLRLDGETEGVGVGKRPRLDEEGQLSKGVTGQKSLRGRRSPAVSEGGLSPLVSPRGSPLPAAMQFSEREEFQFVSYFPTVNTLDGRAEELRRLGDEVVRGLDRKEPQGEIEEPSMLGLGRQTADEDLASQSTLIINPKGSSPAGPSQGSNSFPGTHTPPSQQGVASTHPGGGDLQRADGSLQEDVAQPASQTGDPTQTGLLTPSVEPQGRISMTNGTPNPRGEGGWLGDPFGPANLQDERSPLASPERVPCEASKSGSKPVPIVMPAFVARDLSKPSNSEAGKGPLDTGRKRKRNKKSAFKDEVESEPAVKRAAWDDLLSL